MSLRMSLGNAVGNVLGKKFHTRLRISRQQEYRFLRRVRGVIHVGANTGQEGQLYESLGLAVIWIEPIPEVFEELKRHIAGFRNQAAFQHLVTDEDDKECSLHISNNGGESSSILDFSGHSQMWPDVKYTHAITMKSITLASLLAREHIDIRGFDGLILDTQGSELRILKGGGNLLTNFRFVKVEVPDFESYRGCCQIGELSAFMASNRFREHSRVPFMHTPNLGTYYDVTYQRDFQ